MLRWLGSGRSIVWFQSSERLRATSVSTPKSTGNLVVLCLIFFGQNVRTRTLFHVVNDHQYQYFPYK